MSDLFINKFNTRKDAKEYSFMEPFVNFKTKIKLLHNTCGTVSEITPWNVFRNFKCRSCYPRKLTNNQFVEKYKSLLEDYEMLTPYTLKHAKLQLKHKACGKTWEPTAKKFIEGRTCPYCRGFSKGESVIEAYLRVNSIQFQQQYSFTDCYHKNKLKFDFAVFNTTKGSICLIEFDGIQHLEGRGSNFYSPDIKIRDNIKTEYAKSNSIPLIRIAEGENILEILKRNFKKEVIPSAQDIRSSYKRKITPELALTIRKNYLGGTSKKDLAKIHTLSDNTILSILRYLIYADIPCKLQEKVLSKLANDKPRCPASKLLIHRESFISMFEEGASLRKIARLFNTSHGMVKKIINYGN